MTGILPRLLTLSLCIFPSVLFALGLGDIRLKSALNEPLDAEIELVSATPDELGSLRASLASPETFARYGLERPIFLSQLDFRVGRSEDGRNVLFVRSRGSVSDPFLTFLVEVNWSRGRLLREYTLLVDPPVYMPGPEETAAAPVAAPQAGETSTARSGVVDRAPESAPRETGVTTGVSRPAPPPAADGTYTVRRNDTLYQISRGLRGGSAADVNRMMVALYRANPDAFGNNMNEMRAGAILRVPADADFEAIAASEAGSEVRRQYAEWRASRGMAAGTGDEEAARLRLVTPSESGEGTATGAGSAAAAEFGALRDRVNQLESELAETRRMLEVRDAELARLQQQMGQQPGMEQPGTTPPVEAQPESGPPTEEITEAPAEEVPVAEEPAPTGPAEQVEAPAVAESEEGTGLVAWVISNWYIPVGVLLLLIAILYGAIWRRRQEPDYGALGRLAAAEAAPRPSRLEREPQTAPVRAPKPKDQDAFLVEEGGERTQLRHNRTAELPRVVEKPRVEPRAEPKSRADETLSSETAINLDQGDPLAEADFHMAYGLYDQAADLVRIAIEREPQRRDLKLKLLEIFFVWGNKDSFLQTARQLHGTSDGAGPGEWDKIAIMGRQIAPDDPLFSQSAPRSSGGEVDLNLEGGENRVDLDLLGTPGDSGGGIDLDLGSESGDDGTTTGESPALTDLGLDFPLEDAPEPSDGSATTREMAARTMESPTIEQPGFHGHDSPTVESPMVRESGAGTIKEKIDSALFRKDSQSSDQTAELALDDLGLDLDALRQAESEGTLESMEQTDHPSDAATMVAGMDEKSRRLMEEAESRARNLEQAGQSPTGTWVLDDKTLAATVQLPGAQDNASTDRVRALQESAADTARRKRVDVDSTAELGGLSAEEMDLDLDRLEQALQSDTAKQPRKGSTDEDRFSTDVFKGGDFESTDIDVDVGAVKRDHDTAPTGTARIPASEMGLPELEPVTMSEVGTKLDLARAYMDMGDPEGARSILEEVMQEGSATQKQEAQRLIDSLPG